MFLLFLGFERQISLGAFLPRAKFIKQNAVVVVASFFVALFSFYSLISLLYYYFSG